MFDHHEHERHDLIRGRWWNGLAFGSAHFFAAFHDCRILILASSVPGGHHVPGVLLVALPTVNVLQFGVTEVPEAESARVHSSSRHRNLAFYDSRCLAVPLNKVGFH